MQAEHPGIHLHLGQKHPYQSALMCKTHTRLTAHPKAPPQPAARSRSDIKYITDGYHGQSVKPSSIKGILKHSISFGRIAMSSGLKWFCIIFKLSKYILFKLLFSEMLCTVLCLYNCTCLLWHMKTFLSCLLMCVVKIIYAKNTKPKQMY